MELRKIWGSSRYVRDDTESGERGVGVVYPCVMIQRVEKKMGEF